MMLNPFVLSKNFFFPPNECVVGTVQEPDGLMLGYLFQRSMVNW
jgi:hypothetical protein